MHADSWKSGLGRALGIVLGLTLFALALFGAMAVAEEPLPPPATKDDLSLLRQALTKAEDDDFVAAHALAGRAKSPVVPKILQWLDYRRGESAAPLDDLIAFIKTNPDWPDYAKIEANVERAMFFGADDAFVFEWFRYRDPVSREGRLRLLKAHVAAKDEKKATALARTTWLDDEFDEGQETAFLADYGRFLRPEDHQARLDRLLWENKETSAKRMYERVDKGWKALAEARLALHENKKDANRLLAKVPTKLRRDPGLIYERVRWRRINDHDDEARALLLSVKSVKEYAPLWWQERRRLARDALNKGHSRDAYRLAASHGLEGGASFAEAEFFAGWVALRFRNDAKTALRHFSRLHEAVSAPISLARGAYWAARAAEATGNKKAAKDWYAKAAIWPATFYGQLAASHVNAKKTPLFAAAIRAANGQPNNLPGSELVSAARTLAVLGEDDLVAPLILRLGELAQGPRDHTLVAELALDIARPDLALRAAKLAAQKGFVSLETLYPLVKLPYPKEEALERPLVLALTRQESQFDPDAKSPAGALGLMQLMPGTAKDVAKDLGIKIRTAELTSNQSLNVRLGSRYLADMGDTFGGSYILSVAAYNAGPTNVRRWLEANGDPRADATIDVIDWIEQIPIEETRNYVQRVLEGVQVYRWRLDKTVTVASLEADLLRGSTADALEARCKAKTRKVVRARTLQTVC